MAKALIGYLNSDLRVPSRLEADNARLRARINDLEALVLRLQVENDNLTAANAAMLLEGQTSEETAACLSVATRDVRACSLNR